MEEPISIEEANKRDKGYEAGGERFARADPDISLDVPVVKIEELSLGVDDLKARVALRTRLAELLEIEAGVSVSLKNVKLEAKGIEAEARFKARLENVDSMIQRTLDSVDYNPELVRDLTSMSEAAARNRNEGAEPEAEEMQQSTSSTS